MAPIDMETIADIKQSGRWLIVQCRSCGRSIQFPPACFPSKLVTDLPVSLAAAYFRCSRCHSKQLESLSLDRDTMNNHRTPGSDR
jgi:transcription elongation factor Elf1